MWLVSDIDFPIYEHTKKVKRRIKFRHHQYVSDYIPLIAVILNVIAIVFNSALSALVIALEILREKPISTVIAFFAMAMYALFLRILEMKYDKPENSKRCRKREKWL